MWIIAHGAIMCLLRLGSELEFVISLPFLNGFAYFTAMREMNGVNMKWNFTLMVVLLEIQVRRDFSLTGKRRGALVMKEWGLIIVIIERILEAITPRKLETNLIHLIWGTPIEARRQ